MNTKQIKTLEALKELQDDCNSLKTLLADFLQNGEFFDQYGLDIKINYIKENLSLIKDLIK